MAAAVVGVDELNAVWELAACYRQTAAALRSVRLFRYHTFDDVLERIEISRDTPQIDREVLQVEIQDTLSNYTEDTMQGAMRASAEPRTGRKRHTDCVSNPCAWAAFRHASRQDD